MKVFGKPPPELSEWVGAEREIMVKRALDNLISEGKLLEIVKTVHRDSGDRCGVDFYVVMISKSKRETITISVGNPNYVSEEQRKHPGLSLYLGVDKKEGVESIQKRLEDWLNKNV